VRPDDVKAFAVELGKTAELFGEPLTEARVLLYLEALGDLDLEAALAGFRRARAELKYFPKPAEVRELVEGTKDDRAECAWLRVLNAIREHGPYASLDFGDAVIHAVVADVWGDWPSACMLSEKDTPFRAREFVKLYRLRAKQPGALRAGHLVGLVEADCRRRGFLAHLPAVRQVPGAPAPRQLEAPAAPPAAEPARALPEPERPAPRRRHLRPVRRGDQLALGHPETA